MHVLSFNQRPMVATFTGLTAAAKVPQSWERMQAQGVWLCKDLFFPEAGTLNRDNRKKRPMCKADFIKYKTSECPSYERPLSSFKFSFVIAFSLRGLGAQQPMKFQFQCVTSPWFGNRQTSPWFCDSNVSYEYGRVWYICAHCARSSVCFPWIHGHMLSYDTYIYISIFVTNLKNAIACNTYLHI